MSDFSTTSQWIKFFRDAGLPNNVSATYAIIFYDNRIQLDMLMDLSKEYLYDMGIKVMGDVIAILKYAKEYHTQLAKEKMIDNIESPLQKKSSTPASRILGRLTRVSPSSRPSQPPQVLKRTQVTTPILARLSKVTPSSSLITSNSSLLDQPSSMSQILKRPHVRTNSPTSSFKASYNTFSGPNVKKIRRALPDDEGAYRIKMPSGNTERSRQILRKQQQLLQLKKKRATVFDRLGDSAVSSSTDVMKTKVSSSVFDRLGSNNDVSTSTVSLSSGKLISSPPLQYRGVLKKTTANNRLSSKSALNRLGNKSGTILLTKRQNIGSRFGYHKQKTVFDRLGK